MPELCDGKDNNCNGTVDEGFDVGASCSAGVGDCQGTGTKVCTADGQGTRCNATPKAEGSACNDGNACTLTDTCQAGSCTGGTPVLCPALDQCHVAGTCNTTTGVCSNPNATNGTSCSDGNACTQSDTCQAGTCTGTNVCSALTVLSPNGGEIWLLNSTQTIRWSSTRVSGKVRIELSRDGGASWKVLSNSTANTGVLNWKVNKPATTQVRIRVSSVLTPSVRDTSDGNFTIK